MFIPIGDSPNPDNYTPWVNYGLIAANVIVFFATYVPLSGEVVQEPVPEEALRWLRQIMAANPGFVPSQYDVFTFLNGYKPGAPQVQDLFAAMFLHAGWAHLLGNMLFLWIYGDNVEHKLGRVRYLLVYLLTGIAATMGFAVLNIGSMVPMIGASGAISGVLGMYFILFPRNVVKVFMLLFPFIFGVYPFNARMVLGFYIIVQNVFPALLSAGQGGGGVAYGAHIGGFVAGVIVALIAERLAGTLPAAALNPRLRSDAHRRSSRASGSTTPKLVTWGTAEDALRQAVQTGDRASAFKQLDTLSSNAVADRLPQEAIVLSQWMAEEDRLIQAFELIRRVLRQHRPPAIDQAEVYYTLGLIRLKQGQHTSAYQHFMDALDFDPRPKTEEQIKKGLSFINIYRRPN